VEIRFPDQSISEELQAVARKKEFIQGNEEDLRYWYFRVLKEPEARYVARQLCWILKVEGIPAYYLALRDWQDLPDLISCLGHREDDLDLFVGLSSLIPTEGCPGVTAPVLAVDQLSSFTRDRFDTWLKGSKKSTSKRKSSGRNDSEPNELFNKLVQSAVNFGDTDEWRAVNYLAANYQPLYERYAELASGENAWSLESVRVPRSRLWPEKRIVDAVFAFVHKETGFVLKYFVRVDVSHMFPMILNHITEYFDR
jgi:PatG C-terminal